MLECAIHPITYSEGILATVVKNGYKKNGRWGNANRSLHNQLYSSLTLFLSNNHNITFVPVYRYLFAI